VLEEGHPQRTEWDYLPRRMEHKGRAFRCLAAVLEDDMAEENRTPDKKIGEIKHAQEQTERTTGHLPPHGPGALHEKEDVKADPKRDPAKKKTGEF
jgi:hypothetical protein